MVNKLYYSHENMNADLDSIYRQMHLDNLKPDVVYGITRGGLIPAVHASHYFSVPMETIKVSTYDATEYGDVTGLVNDLRAGKLVMLVDDICDTGNTLKYVVDEIIKNGDDSLLNSLLVVTLIHNEGQNTFEPDYYGTAVNKVENPVWVVFDWEY